MKKNTLLMMILLFLMTAGNVRAQIANAACNQGIGTPLISQNFNGLTVTSSKGLLGNHFSNLGYQIDNSLSNVSTASGIFGTDVWIRTTDTNDVYPAGTYAGYEYDITNISIGDIGTVTISTYKGGVLQESKDFSSINIIELNGRKRSGFEVSKPFDAIQLRYKALAVGFPMIQAYYPFVNRLCKSPNITCNLNTSLQRPAFGVFVNDANTGISGLNLASVTNTQNAIDADNTTSAQLTNFLSVVGSASLAVKDATTSYPGGTFAGFDIENANFISLAAFNTITINTYLDGKLQEKSTTKPLVIGAPVLDYANRMIVGFETTYDFDEIQIVVSQPAGLTLGTTNVYGAVVKKPCEGKALDCNTTTTMAEPNYPVNINSQRTGVSGIFSFAYSVTKPQNVIDNDPNNFASLTVPAALGTSASLSVLKSLADYPAGTYAGFDIQNVNFLNVEFLKNITLTTYNNGVQQEKISGNGILLGVGTDLLASSGRSVMGFVTKLAFDELQISVNNVAALNLGTTKVYKMVVMNPCPTQINCKSSYYLTQPKFPVVLNSQRTGLKTLACLGCAVSNPGFVIDNDPNTVGKISLTAGVGNSGSISVLDPTATYPKGTFAGYTIKDKYFLVQGDLLEFITVRTYLKGVLQESKTSTDLIDLSLLIPIWGTGTKNVGFYTKKEFDEVQIETVSLASVINNLEVYGAFIDTRLSDGQSLSCVSQLVAAADQQTINAGSTGTVSVLGNDTINGSPANGSNVILSQVATSNTGVTLDPNTGLVSVAAGTLAGTYTINYKLCDKLNDFNCKETTATITVPMPVIDAVKEDFTGIQSISGGNTSSVLLNDTIGGQAATTSNVTLSAVTVPSGMTLNTDGTITVSANTLAGKYDITYKICDKVNASNCDTVTSTVTVVPPVVDAVNDSQTLSSGQTGSVSVLNNDTFNGDSASLTNVNLSQVSTSNPKVTLDTTTGLIKIAVGTPAGNYTVDYKICDKLNTGNCDTATIAVVVTAPVIVANGDVFPAINNAVGGTTASVLVNDTIDGQPTNSTNVTVAASNLPSGLTMNADGTITVGTNAAEGTYNIVYTIADKINPTNTATATAQVVVTQTKVVAQNDAITVSAGNTGSNSVLANDTLNGLPATLSNVTLSSVSVPAGFTLNSDGTISVASGIPAGTYNVVYKISDKTYTSVSATATAVVTVPAPVIIANGDVLPSINNAVGGTTASVLVNDTIDGQPANSTTVTVTASNLPSGLTMNTDGTITVGTNAAEGTYNIVYTIADKINPTNTATATAQVTVTQTKVVAQNDAMTVSAGNTGSNSVLANDTLNGLSATTSNVTLAPVAVPLGLTLNSDGTISVASGTSAGTYNVVYKISDKTYTSVSATATAVVTVPVPVIVANPDVFASINNASGGTTASVFANDTIGGQSANSSNVTVAASNLPSGLTMNADGTITVGTNAAEGTYNIVYTIADKINPTNMATSTAQVVVIKNTIDAVNDSQSIVSGTSGIISVLANDTLNGLPIATSSVILTTVSTTNSGILLNPITGVVSVAAGTSAGTYTLVYKIADVTNPNLFDTATVTITVTASSSPDMAANVSVSSATYTYGNPMQVFYKITNAGVSVTNGSEILVTIYKPLTGNMTLVNTPTGWTLKSQNTSAFIFSTTKIMNAGEAANIIVNFTNTTSVQSEQTTFNMTIKNGSGGETNYTNNTAFETVFKVVK